jgi:transposase
MPMLTGLRAEVAKLADVIDTVVGVDTHRDTHTLAACSPAGVAAAVVRVDNDEAGYAEAVAFIAAHATGPRVVVAVEGTRSYGIGLTRALTAAGLAVVEVERPQRIARRRGKSDPIDARLAAQTALRLPAHALPTPRADGDREALRILLAARTELTGTRTRQVNQLRALLLTGDQTDRATARARLNTATLTALTRRRTRPDATREHVVRTAEIRRLAAAIRTATDNLTANDKHLTTIVGDLTPTLLTRHGLGPVTAAQAIVSWSHPGRCRNDAAYAALAGVNPIPASSGQTTRHRLNRGGDRALNRALHTITLTRARSCPRTHTYITRRRAEGKTDREIRRCLKRYIARELHRHLTHELTPPPTP